MMSRTSALWDWIFSSGETLILPLQTESGGVRASLQSGDLPPELYHDFMDIGFRRSGKYFYRPVCAECNECRP